MPLLGTVLTSSVVKQNRLVFVGTAVFAALNGVVIERAMVVGDPTERAVVAGNAAGLAVVELLFGAAFDPWFMVQRSIVALGAVVVCAESVVVVVCVCVLTHRPSPPTNWL